LSQKLKLIEFSRVCLSSIFNKLGLTYVIFN
jgi:hypothetical protein